jgi:dihydroorotate dehydrogenase (NAD+) catalytic subunit
VGRERLGTKVGSVELKNPLIAAAAEHFIEPEGIRRAIAAGAGAVVVKSTNESEAAKDQLQRAEYAVLDEKWRPVAWNADAPAGATIACRSGLTPQPFDTWLDDTIKLDRLAHASDCYAVASIILADLDPAVRMARQIEQAGIRIFELNIGTPYARQARGIVSTELDPARVTMIVQTIRAAIKIPLWVKLSGQSEHVPLLAKAAFDGGANSVVMAGRLLGMIPDVETLEPLLGTTLGVGGYWNLPLTCHWLSLTRAELGPDRPLIGINGARSGLDIARMMLAGASAVAIASPVMLRGYSLLGDALTEFDDYLDRKNLNATDLIGRAADVRKSFRDMPLKSGNWRNYIPQVDSYPTIEARAET